MSFKSFNGFLGLNPILQIRCKGSKKNANLQFFRVEN